MYTYCQLLIICHLIAATDHIYGYIYCIQIYTYVRISTIASIFLKGIHTFRVCTYVLYKKPRGPSYTVSMERHQ